jgi:precorrin isomerase
MPYASGPATAGVAAAVARRMIVVDRRMVDWGIKRSWKWWLIYPRLVGGGMQ